MTTIISFKCERKSHLLLLADFQLCVSSTENRQVSWSQTCCSTCHHFTTEGTGEECNGGEFIHQSEWRCYLVSQSGGDIHMTFILITVCRHATAHAQNFLMRKVYFKPISGGHKNALKTVKSFHCGFSQNSYWTKSGFFWGGVSRVSCALLIYVSSSLVIPLGGTRGKN